MLTLQPYNMFTIQIHFNLSDWQSVEMDSHLLGQAVQFHGPDLVRNIQKEDQQLTDSIIDYLPQYREREQDIGYWFHCICGKYYAFKLSW